MLNSLFLFSLTLKKNKKKYRREEVGKLESGDTGRGVQETVWGDVDSGIDCLNYFAGLCVVEVRELEFL